MFTGIIEEVGLVEAITPGAEAIRLTLRSRLCAQGTKLGDSIAVNGCCLTVVGIRAAKGGGKSLDFDLLQETWRRTNLSQTKVGSAVNLERALAANARLGGHFVTGHVDATGTITQWERRGQDHLLEISAPANVLRYVVSKGSIAVDGISLTVAGVTKRSFRLWIIPHTHSVTALRERAVGHAVNLEADLLGKYVERLLDHRSAPSQPAEKVKNGRKSAR